MSNWLQVSDKAFKVRARNVPPFSESKPVVRGFRRIEVDSSKLSLAN
jgi:hypothetical protein